MNAHLWKEINQAWVEMGHVPQKILLTQSNQDHLQRSSYIRTWYRSIIWSTNHSSKKLMDQMKGSAEIQQTNNANALYPILCNTHLRGFLMIA